MVSFSCLTDDVTTFTTDNAPPRRARTTDLLDKDSILGLMPGNNPWLEKTPIEAILGFVRARERILAGSRLRTALPVKVDRTHHVAETSYLEYGG